MTKQSSFFVCFLFLFVQSIAFAGGKFPLGPDPRLTPGSLCQHPDAYRYPERIPYCNREVETSTKYKTIRDYDSKLGFSVGRMDRQQFKIDHFIPLCAGGSNDESNLWPQHESVYRITDPLEPEICQKMQAGVLSQAKAVELIRRAKLNLSEAESILDYIHSL